MTAKDATFQDHFSGHAREYAAHRPGYPPALFERLAAITPSRGCAIDMATGNGQAARQLAKHFDHVIALDASSEQIAHAAPNPKITYGCAPAEATGLDDDSADLITVAQALHWFDHPRFFAEAARVAKPGAVFAAWTYGLFTVDEEVDAIVREFYEDQIGPYWPAERRHVDAGYTTIAVPGTPIPFEAPPMVLEWTVDALLAYLGTWSASKAYADATGEDPVDQIEMAMRVSWGEDARPVEWPVASVVTKLP